VVEYPQGWLATALEKNGQKQADWRTDPKRAGISCCMGDIGTHAENLAEYITGMSIESLCADLTTFLPGRKLDDDGSVLLRFKGGARGVLMASQISAGEENALRIRVYGERGGLDWAQEEPNTLTLKWANRPREVLRTGGSGLSSAAASATRLPSGHPEGFLEAFANIYRNFAEAVRASGKKSYDFPTVRDGVRGMAFIEAVVKSSKNNSKWVKVGTAVPAVR
jgi:predicted dehydrogenase